MLYFLPQPGNKLFSFPQPPASRYHMEKPQKNESKTPQPSFTAGANLRPPTGTTIHFNSTLQLWSTAERGAGTPDTTWAVRLLVGWETPNLQIIFHCPTCPSRQGHNTEKKAHTERKSQPAPLSTCFFLNELSPAPCLQQASVQPIHHQNLPINLHQAVL